MGGDFYRNEKNCLICEQQYTAKSATQKWCDACIPDAQARHRFQRYGLSHPEFNRMLERQSGHCALCPSTAKLVVDHCHQTGMVRGLLCYACNIALGRVDVAGWVQKAESYSRSHLFEGNEHLTSESFSKLSELGDRAADLHSWLTGDLVA